jgi:glycogen debranching enzyme
LRSLARTEAHYRGHLTGSPLERDAAYHQGTVWSWLLGPFAIAHYRVYRDAATALGLLHGIDAHLSDACIGQISEVFDGDAPFTPRGCFAQAWSVAEVLRAFGEINGSEAGTAGGC